MIAKSFDASKYLTNLRGRDYLEVKWRLLWLRTEHPDANVETELVKHEENLALFRAHVMIPGGGEATGWGSETATDFHDYIEKAETKALGRALAALGYGTQFCEDFDFSAESGGRERRSKGASDANTRVVDSPVSRRNLNVIKDAGPGTATEPQLKAIYAIARTKQDLQPSDLDDRCRQAYGHAPAELTKQQASEFIDSLRDARQEAQPVRHMPDADFDPRFDGLSGGARRLLDYVAVLEGGAKYETLRHLARVSEEDMVEDLREVVNAGLIAPRPGEPNMYDFVDPLVEEHIRSEIGGARLPKLKARAEGARRRVEDGD